MRYLMTFGYDGTNYYGYQKQSNKVTIQGEIESVLYKVCGNRNVSIHSSGRTDAHVHAINQKAHFDLDNDIDVEKFKHSINSLLSDSIYVKNIEKVDNDFHSRYNIKEKSYIYKINMGEYNPFERNYVYQYNKYLDINSIKKATEYLIGTHDFKSFTKASSLKDSYVRTIYSIDIENKNDILFITFTGNGFLRYMIRNIVGSLIDVGSGKINPSDIKVILDKQNRECASITASPNGLYLLDVKY